MEIVSDQTGLFLIDAEAGTAVYSYIEAYSGVFSWDSKTGRDTGFDHNGLFVVDRKTRKEYFRSMHFIQEALPTEKSISPNGKGYTISPSLLTDTATGRAFKVTFNLGDHERREYKVITRPLSKDDFYAIDPLRKVLIASIETGNPIYWG